MGIGLLSARLIQNFRNFAVSVVQNRTSLVNGATVNPVLLSSMHDEHQRCTRWRTQSVFHEAILCFSSPAWGQASAMGTSYFSFLGVEVMDEVEKKYVYQYLFTLPCVGFSGPHLYIYPFVDWVLTRKFANYAKNRKWRHQISKIKGVLV